MTKSKDLNQYIADHSEKEDPILTELSRETHLKVMHPRMLSGQLQGQILESYSRMIQPEKILELGTFTGYSAICMSKGLIENGQLITIDIDDETAVLARKYFTKANLNEKIEIRIGDALAQIELLKQAQETFDLVFIDADKSQYVEYYQNIFPLVRTGGFIIVDNVLWNGKVVEEIDKKDLSTKGILEFNRLVQDDERVSNYILPIRDGMMVIRKQ